MAKSATTDVSTVRLQHLTRMLAKIDAERHAVVREIQDTVNQLLVNTMATPGTREPVAAGAKKRSAQVRARKNAAQRARWASGRQPNGGTAKSRGTKR